MFHTYRTTKEISQTEVHYHLIHWKTESIYFYFCRLNFTTVDNHFLSMRIKNATESATLAMTRLSRELRNKGEEIITLSIGEPDFNTPEPVKEAAIKAINDNITHYTPVAGFNILREAIAKKLKRDNNLDFTRDQIVVSNGAKQSLANIFLSILDPGDEVIIPSPFWVSYIEMVKIAGGIPVLIDTNIEDNFRIDPKKLTEAITPKTKAFLINSPNNPTGAVYSKEELAALVSVLEKQENILIVSDEIYEHINFKGKHCSIASFDSVKERVVVVNGVSKGYAMTGWRIGYMAAPKFLVDACIKLQGQYTSGPSGITQMAALTAVENNPESSDYLSAMRNSFHKRRDLMIQAIRSELPHVKTNIPDGAFYLFPDISYYLGKTDGKRKIKTANDLTMYLLEEADVALVSGESFGSKNNIRISYATSPEHLIQAVKQMKPALNKLHD